VTMEAEFWGILSTFTDLLSLACCLGALICRLWVLPPDLSNSDSTVARLLFGSVRRLLGGLIVLLALASMAQLLIRVAVMTERPITEISSVLPTILLRTHYGRVWILRTMMTVALFAVWWLERKDRCTRTRTAVMLGLAAGIGLTRSLTGHAADWGDPSFAELFDWMHLCAASAWGGSLWVFALCVFPVTLPSLDEHRESFAAMASRLSTVSGVALGTLVVTAFANACYQVQTLPGLVGTSYGRVILIKILLLGVLVILGATNRYLSVPALQVWGGQPAVRSGRLFHFLVGRRLPQQPEPAHMNLVAHRFALQVQVEALLVGLVLFWTAVLLHSIPAAHLVHMTMPPP
jgi:putative copper export protein